jgi:hypothetical protein
MILLKIAGTVTLIAVSFTLIFCNTKKQVPDAATRLYIHPEAIDSTININYYLRLNFHKDLSALDVTREADKLLIYDYNNPGDTEKITHGDLAATNMIEFTNGRIGSITENNNKLFAFCYTERGFSEQVVRYYKNYLDDIDTVYSNYIYDSFGNILSSYRYEITKKSGMKFIEYNEYSYYYEGKVLVVYCKGIDSDFLGQYIYQKEFRFLNGKIISLTGNGNSLLHKNKEKWYWENYTYNKDSFLIQKKMNSGIAVHYIIYKRDSLNRIVKKIDSLYGEKSAHTIKEIYQYRYFNNKTEETCYRSENEKNEPPLIKTSEFDNHILIRETENETWTKYRYQYDNAGNWFLKETETGWKNDEAVKNFTYRKIEYSNTAATGNKKILVPGADQLKEKIINQNNYFLSLHYEE